jgi:GT2 family glycosyltransferase
VDNGSEDGTVEIARAWADGRTNARLVRAPDVRGAAHARNRGVAAAEGDFIAFCDADDVVTPQWLTELTRAAIRADLVGGSLSTRALNGAEVRSWQEEPSQTVTVALLVAHGFLRFASGCNFGMWTEVFDQLGGLDERFAAGEDIDLSWRAQLAGYRLGFAPRAVVEHEYRQDLRSLARQQYRYGVSSGQLFRRFKAAGMVRSSPVHAVMTWARLLVTLPPALGTGAGRGRWVATAAQRLGRVAGSIRHRVAVL